VFSDTEIDSAAPPALIQACRETHCKVFTRPGSAELAFTLLIGQACASQGAAHRLHGVRHELARKLRARGHRFDAGVGQHPGNGWECRLGEPSLLAYGPDLEAAEALRRRLGQNAIVWVGTDAVPRLALLE
jgi:hypothetical protein